MLFLLILLAGIPRAQAESGVTLSEAFQSALNKTETTQLQNLRTLQSEERVSQNKGGILPQTSLISSYSRQQSVVGSRPESGDLRVNLTQPLFHGLREFHALSSSKADLEVQRALNQQSTLTLYVSVGQAFYSVLAAERDLANLKSLLELTEKRISDLASRTKIGRSRNSELLTSQSQGATLKTQTQAAELALNIARDQFMLVTGLDQQTPLIEGPSPIPATLESLQKYLSTIEDRPDLKSAKHSVVSAEEQVSFAKGGHWPSLDFSANYYFKHPRPSDRVKWDIGLTLNLPIFRGGITSAQVAEATARVQERELLFSQTRRTVDKEIRVAYQSVASGIEQLSSLKSGLEIAEKNYQEQNRDYRFGLSTNLDVLLSLNALQEAKRNLDRVKYQTLTSWVVLQTAAGKIQ